MIVLDSRAKHELIEIDNPEVIIYRLIEVHRLFDFFDTKLLSLVAPKLWDDPYEDIFSHIRVAIKGRKNRFINYQGYTELFFGQCWTLNDENDATWRIFSPNKDRVKIKTTVNKLHNEMIKIDHDFFRSYIGKVKYLSEIEYINKIVDDIKNGGNFHREKLVNDYFLTKRDTFSGENEIRLLVKLPKPEGKYLNAIYQDHNHPDICNIPISDPNALIDEIVFDPRMPKSLVEAYTNHLIGKFKYQENNIFQSKIYTKPDISLTIDYPF